MNRIKRMNERNKSGDLLFNSFPQEIWNAMLRADVIWYKDTLDRTAIIFESRNRTEPLTEKEQKEIKDWYGDLPFKINIIFK